MGSHGQEGQQAFKAIVSRAVRATGLAINLNSKAEEAAESLEAANMIVIINAGTQELLKVEEEQIKATGLDINLNTKAEEAVGALEAVNLNNRPGALKAVNLNNRPAYLVPHGGRGL